MSTNTYKNKNFSSVLMKCTLSHNCCLAKSCNKVTSQNFTLHGLFSCFSTLLQIESTHVPTLSILAICIESIEYKNVSTDSIFTGRGSRRLKQSHWCHNCIFPHEIYGNIISSDNLHHCFTQIILHDGKSTINWGQCISVTAFSTRFLHTTF